MTDFDSPAELWRTLAALLSRRAMLRGAGAAGALAVGAPLFAACGTSGATRSESQQAAEEDRSVKDKVVNFSNWPLYLDSDETDGARRPTLEEFRAKSGITVNYTEDINDNDQFFGKLRPDLAAGNDVGRDLIVLTDWMAARLIRLRWAQKLAHLNVPHLINLRPALRNVTWDPQRNYTLPWQSGITALAYNRKVTGRPVRDMHDLLTAPDLKGRVTALTDMRDTMGLILLQQGKNPADFTDRDFEAAIDTLDRAVRGRQIRKFTGNEYVQDLQAGNIAAAVAWSGDIRQIRAENPAIEFVIPEAGGVLFSDNMLIPNKAAHKRNAEALMNYYYHPKVAAKVAAAVQYICPVEGAREELARTNPVLAKDPLIFPDDATLKRLAVFRGLDEKTERSYDDMFQKVIGG